MASFECLLIEVYILSLAVFSVYPNEWSKKKFYRSVMSYKSGNAPYLFRRWLRDRGIILPVWTHTPVWPTRLQISPALVLHTAYLSITQSCHACMDDHTPMWRRQWSFRPSLKPRFLWNRVHTWFIYDVETLPRPENLSRTFKTNLTVYFTKFWQSLTILTRLTAKEDPP